MADERPRKKKVERASSPPQTEAAPAAPRAKSTRIVVVVGVWAAIAIYLLAPVSAALMIALAALLGLMYWRSPGGEPQPRRMLGAGALLLLAGIASVGIGPSDVGVGLTLLALLVLVFGIHTFGRLGPEEAASGAP
ncbi:MAG: hypothetical protein HUU21_13710 [Polyangiaceae bacterium]|nr:hypothetical protein [Polyangiaceae bacterium]NUQ74606.1 hypothetical protein [Polyangiaceae bacterium]